jgi:mRNA-degrading endonuclease RelE of RelBE toxin-antitoxin system
LISSTGRVLRFFRSRARAAGATKDLNLFDIKKLVSDSSVNYYRLRKGKYRVVFKIEDEDIQDIRFIENYIDGAKKSEKKFITGHELLD